MTVRPHFIAQSKALIALYLEIIRLACGSVFQIQMSEHFYCDIQEARTEKAFMGTMLQASNTAYLS